MYTTKVVSGSAAFPTTYRGSVPPFLECPVKNLTLQQRLCHRISC
uniref:Sum1 n=1 Tax=Arundo donax TaxID=35708 RepID=A0A0A9GG66_ARUDO